MTGEQQQRGDQRVDRDVPLALDVLVGAGTNTAMWAWGIARPFVGAGHRLLTGTVRAAGRWVPEPVLTDLATRGEQVRSEALRMVRERVAVAFPQAVEDVLTLLDLTTIVRRHVDLDAIAEGIDVDAVVARTDLDAVVARVDIDVVVSRLDLDAIASRLDLDALVSLVDTDAIVARVDLDAVVNRLDLAGIAYRVIDAIDLPGIVRESTGTMASETVHGVRVQGMQADDAVDRFVDRLLRRSRSESAPPGPVSS